MEIIDNKKDAYMVYALAVMSLIASILSADAVILVAVSVLLLIAVTIFNSGHIISSLLVRRSRIVEISGNYKLGRNLVSASRKSNGAYVSMSVALLKPKKELMGNSEALVELLNSLSEHFEFSIELSEIDKNKMIENLRTRLRVREIAMTRLNPKSYDKINNLKRQMDIIDHDISALVSSGNSFEFILKIKSICTSQDEYEAEASSAKNIETLSNKFSAAIGIDYEILKGEKLLLYSGA